MQVCWMCKIQKPDEEFSWRYKDKGVRQNLCKPCARIYSKEYRQSRPEIIKGRSKKRYQGNKDKILQEKKSYYLKNRDHILEVRRKNYHEGKATGKTQAIARKSKMATKFSMTLEDYDRMANEQNHLCAICHQSRKLVIDHSHKTGKVRGLLCKSCNSYLGSIRESLESLERAKRYLIANQE